MINIKSDYKRDFMSSIKAFVDVSKCLFLSEPLYFADAILNYFVSIITNTLKFCFK